MNLFPPANILREELMNPSYNERWIKHYSSSHNILLVGEGDFSFSLCLGLSFGCATNIIATTLDSYDELISKYKHAKANLVVLRILGASVLHGVDATNMWSVPGLRCRKFHRIIYNFPHAGFYGKESDPSIVLMHRDLVRRFLQNASAMLNVVGEIHVNHKATAPFDSWRVEDLGSECSLVCIAQDKFSIGDYPGYHNKRGSGSRADEPFPLGSCKTFRFRLHPVAVHNLIMRKLDSIQTAAPQMLCTRGGVVQQQLPPPPPPPPPHRPLTGFDDGVALQRCANASEQCRRIFRGYLNHVEETFGDTSYDVGASVKEALRLGFEVYMSNAEPGRPLSDFISILEEFRRLSILRSERLRQMLFRRHDLR